MADMGWSRHIADMEDNAIEACLTTAMKNGHTKEEADNCDDGSVGCPDCPFRPQLGDKLIQLAKRRDEAELNLKTVILKLMEYGKG